MTAAQRKRGERCSIQSFSVKPSDKWILDKLDEWARRDRVSKSDLIVHALKVYFKEHWRGGGGNPQSTLFDLGEPLPEINVEALREARLRKAVIFLRFRVGLSYQMIAHITDTSYGFIYKVCKEVSEDKELMMMRGYRNFDCRKLRRKKKHAKDFMSSLNLYHKRFTQWMNGKFNTVEEAFLF